MIVTPPPPFEESILTQTNLLFGSNKFCVNRINLKVLRYFTQKIEITKKKKKVNQNNSWTILL